jgi:hypothetical protein
MEKQLSDQGWFYKKQISVIPDNESVDNIPKGLDEVVAQTTPYQTIINIIAPFGRLIRCFDAPWVPQTMRYSLHVSHP